MPKRLIEIILHDLGRVEEALKYSRGKSRHVFLLKKKKELGLELATHPSYDPFLASNSPDARWWQV